MKMATQQALTTQRRRDVESDEASAGAEDSGTTNSLAFPRATIAQFDGPSD